MLSSRIAQLNDIALSGERKRVHRNEGLDDTGSKAEHCEGSANTCKCSSRHLGRSMALKGQARPGEHRDDC
jgi:hypothetical protein